MPKILITGSNGLIGQKLLAALDDEKYTVIAASKNADRSPAKKKHTFQLLDITDAHNVNACLSEHKPDLVIHTAAMSLPDLCEKNPDECQKVNVEGTRNVVNACEKAGSHVIFLSTDFVFDGTAGPYHEEDIPHPLSIYGKSKLKGEEIVKNSRVPWSIVRTILVFGVLPNSSRPSIITFVTDHLKKNQKIRVVKDQYRMPTLAEDLAAGILKIVDLKAAGTFHLSGDDFVSIYEFACLIAGTFGLNQNLIEPVSTAALKEAAQRPLRTGFLLEKAKMTLGYTPHKLKQGLTLIKKQMV